MLRYFKIKTRLLISFFITVFFTLMVGLTGYASITSLRNLSVRTIQNVSIMNNVYDYNIAIDTGIFNLLYTSDINLIQYVLQTTKEHTEGFLAYLNEYLKSQNQFSDVFTPGEMQNMANLLEIYEETYIPIINEIFTLVEQGQREKALSVYINRFTPIFNTFIYYINTVFIKNLNHSLTETARNNESASINAYLMLGIVLLSLIVSVMLALAVTKSIAVPLSELEISTEKVVSGKLDVKIEQSQNNDEIAHLSQRLQETIRQLNYTQELELATIEARHEKEKAEAESKSKGEFLARMSHEIRTPMNAITGMAELALREDMPDTAREHILTIKQAGANLLSIINDILDFSKIESGKLQIVPSDYLFSSLINDVISIIRMKVIDSYLQFAVNIDCNIPNALFGDEIRIRQVLLNILSNAVKYTEKGFVSLAVTAEIAANAASENIVNITMEVRDSGRGLKQEDMEKLFDEFVQFDLAKNRGIEGTGLGLAITRSLVKAMGGDISASSEYGRGSVFTVTLPQKIRSGEKLATIENPNEKRVLVYELRTIYANSIVRTVNNLGVECALAANDSELIEKISTGAYSFVFVASGLYENVRDLCSRYESKAKIVLLTEFGEAAADLNLNILVMPVYSISVANTLNGIVTDSTFSINKEAAVRFTAVNAKVLVVDDIGTNLKVAEGLLLPYKMQVDLCQSGPEAIEAIKLNAYDLVFMDHMMPEMDGIQATAAIRAWEAENPGYRTPIVALTANAVSGMKEMFIENGFSDFLSKPIDISKLDEMLDRWIPQEKRGMANEKTGMRSEGGSSSIPDFPAIPGVDAKRGIAMTGGTEAAYRTVLSMFCKDVEKRLPLLQNVPDTSADADSLTAFVTQVHALKSASASIGAEKVSARAAELEAAGKEGNLAAIRKNLSGFAEQLAELVKNIHAALEAHTTAASNEMQPPESSGPLPAGLLHELETALRLQKAGDIDRILDELKKLPLNSKTIESLEQISDEVLMAEYDKAAGILAILH
jgi:signal transduction histidine kinase/CheY-like chemotaxis protein